MVVKIPVFELIVSLYIFCLIERLKTICLCILQVDYARNHWYDYIFTYDAISPTWFSDQNFGHHIKMELPPDLHDNSRWLGLTIYASYTTQKQQAGLDYKQDSRIFLHFSGLSNEVPCAPYIAFPLGRDILDDSSPRLLIFYIPRSLFKLNQCSRIGVLFESNDPGVELKMYRIYLVYEQNVDEFVQTLVEYILGCPEAYHHTFNMNLLDVVAMMQDCNHEKDNCCSFSLERLKLTGQVFCYHASMQ